MENTGTKESCTCKECKSACTHKPGWFLPGEAEKAALFLGMPLQEFFETKLGVDWWEGKQPIFILAPGMKGKETGTEYPGDPRGTCVFYEKGLCTIHSVKPFECRESIHNHDPGERHNAIAKTWNTKENQQQIEEVLGRKPQTEDFPIGSIFDILNRW